MHIVAAKAVAFLEARQQEFVTYQQAVLDNAQALANELMAQGMKLVTGGTDNHRVLIDFTETNITGKVAEAALNQVNITVNKNMIPFDTRKPMETSGIRIGTPALTTRGMKEPEMKQIALWIGQVLKNSEDEAIRGRVRGEVAELCKHFPLYQEDA